MLTSDHVLAIRSCAFFGDLAGKALWEIVEIAEERRYAARQPLMRRGDSGDCLFIVVEGRVAVEKSLGIRSLRLAVIGPPGAVGEIGVIDGGARTATVIAETDVVALRLDRDQLIEVLDRYPELWKGVALSLCALARKATAMEEAPLLPMRARLTRLLLALNDGSGNVPVTQADLAQMLGTHRGTITRLLTELRRAGILTTVAGRITILDHAGLASIDT